MSHYFLVFSADERTDRTWGVISNRQLMEIAPGVYGSHISIIEGYTTLSEGDCAAIMKSGWGYRLKNIVPMYALKDGVERIFSTACIEKEFPGLEKYGGMDKLKKEYARHAWLDTVYLDL